MTPEALAAALRLRLPNTEIVLGDKPGRVVVKMAPSPYVLTVFIALSKSGGVATVGAEDPTQRPRDDGFGFKPTPDEVIDRIRHIASGWCTPNSHRIYGDPTIEPRIRAWAHLPDVLPMIRPKVGALLDADRKALVIMRDEVAQAELRASALERALGVTP